MADRTVGFGIVGAGLMGREFASAAARWLHLADPVARPRIVAVADPDAAALSWYERLEPAPVLLADYEQLLDVREVEAVYVAVPHHLHVEVMTAVLRAGKHLFGEKPFGIDLAANRAIAEAVAEHPGQLVRCSSELPFYPGGQRVARWLAEERAGRVIEVRAQFLHSSDLDPNKPINWKRRAAFNGEYGCMGDLGMHALHLPLRAGFEIQDVRAILSNIVPERPDGHGGTAACDTWDNAVLLCTARQGPDTFPLRVETKRIAPGETNTWTIEVDGTAGSIRYSTKHPKTLLWMDYTSGAPQAWQQIDLGYESAYPAVTGGIFEFGFSDAILQMWAAYLDELDKGREGMRQPFYCATPSEAAATHRLFTAALRSHAERSVVALEPATSPPGRPQR
jgi:predicted dehydrogenase